MPGNTVESSWSDLDSGASTASAKFGLFGYDITCLEYMCANAEDRTGECAAIQARGLDGLSFGGYIKHPVSGDVAFGFHYAESSDTWVVFEEYKEVSPTNVVCTQNFSVTSLYWTTGAPVNGQCFDWGTGYIAGPLIGDYYYGLSGYIFVGNEFRPYLTGTSTGSYHRVFRFIGQ